MKSSGPSTNPCRTPVCFQLEYVVISGPYALPAMSRKEVIEYRKPLRPVGFLLDLINSVGSFFLKPMKHAWPEDCLVFLS